jgi:hypothetical protein
MTMLLIAAALATSAAPPPSTGARAQATAMIRVVQLVRLRLDGSPNHDVPRPRMAAVRNSDGVVVTENIIEFE